MGFTLLEMTLVLALVLVLAMTAGMSLSGFFSSRQLETYTDAVTQSLRQAQTYAMARYRDSTWGIYFDTDSNRWTLFKGDSFATRDTAFDLVSSLPAPLAFTNIAFNEGGSEMVFNKSTGETLDFGLFAILEEGKKVIFTINRYGQIETR